MRWIVAQPAAAPELIWLADGLAASGRLAQYISSTAFAANSRWAHPQLVRRFPPLGRRLLPESIDASVVTSAGTGTEFAFKYLHGRPSLHSIQLQLMRHRAQVVHRAARRQIRRQDLRAEGLIVQAGEARRTLAEARTHGLQTVVNQSIVHKRFMATEILEEIERYPEWAEALLPYIRTERELDELDQELMIADRILVQSQFQAEVLTSAGVPSEKISVVPLGVVHPLAGAVERRPRTRRDTLRIGWLGQLTQRKGLADLVTAIRGLGGSVDLCLEAVGTIDGPSHVLRDAPFLSLLGTMSRVEIQNWFETIDVLVSPSLLEGFSLAPVEAMAHSVPVVVSERLYISPFIENGVNGWVVPARAVDDLRSTLATIAEMDPAELTEIGRCGQRLVSDLTWDNYQRNVAIALEGPS